MNILIENAYALRFMWSYIKCNFNKYNLKYWVLPFIYLVIMLLVVPKPSVLVNEVTYITVDSYKTEETREEKVAYILKKYNLTEYQFNVLSAIVLSEAESNSYNDAYAVINTIYNRTHSKSWVKFISNKFGKDTGGSLYYQAIAPNQFVVYQHGTYKKHLNNTTVVGYDAIIDFLYTEDILHNYLSFRAHNIKRANSAAFSSKGNNYFNKLSDENRI